MYEESPLSNSIVLISNLVLIVLYLVGLWKVYTKAGKPGWASLIPFYNVYVLLKIVGRPGWWLLLYIVPFLNIVIMLIVALDLGKAFKRGTAFSVVLLWLFGPIGYMILGFGKSTYSAPAAKSAPPATAAPAAPAPTEPAKS